MVNLKNHLMHTGLSLGFAVLMFGPELGHFGHAIEIALAIVAIWIEDLEKLL
jgi:hypothetical protein